MREIEFRVWDGGYMDYDVLVDSQGAWGIPDVGYNTPHREVNKYSDEAIIMQYTGLKDKNGKKIFEGDVLSDEVEVDGVMVKSKRQVFFSEKTASWRLDISYKQDKKANNKSHGRRNSNKPDPDPK